MIQLLCSLDSFREWSGGNKERVVGLMLDQVEDFIPGLKKSVEVMAMRTPEDLAAMTWNEKGCAYGLANSIKQYGPFRLKQKTPLKNLFLAGHYTQPGGGLYCVSESGKKAAALVMEAVYGNSALRIGWRANRKPV